MDSKPSDSSCSVGSVAGVVMNSSIAAAPRVDDEEELDIFSELEFYEPFGFAQSIEQQNSLAELPESKKYPLYERVTEDNLDNYHKISCRPITVDAEEDMELVSDLLEPGGERYLHNWEIGIYHCSRCKHPLYNSEDKYHGPCVWPSFRRAISTVEGEGRHAHSVSHISTAQVYPYNNYPRSVTVKEVYCAKCDLFIGHQFDDAKEKGDTSLDAKWRH
jgi:peptide-methionine (R)-S-oxide reductase